MIEVNIEWIDVVWNDMIVIVRVRVMIHVIQIRFDNCNCNYLNSIIMESEIMD